MRTVTRYTASCGSVMSSLASMPSRNGLARRTWGVYVSRDTARRDRSICTRQNMEAGRARFLHGRPALVVA
jgi:hypothetical protein